MRWQWYLGKFVFALTTAGILVSSDLALANSETGPELFAPDNVLIVPSVEPAPKPEGQPQAVSGGSTVDRTAPSSSDMTSNPAGAPSVIDDGWVTKGSRSQSARPGGAQSSSGASSIKPPPASLPVPQVSPQTSVPIYGGVSQGTGIPYPYGTPAPVSDQIGRSWPGQTRPMSRPILGGGGVSQSPGLLASVGRWWNSLWGKKPLDQPAASSFGSRTNAVGGWTAATPNPGTVVPWNGSGGAPAPVLMPGGSTSALATPPYATPYALPPRSSEGSALSSPPQTASPGQGGTGQTQTVLIPPRSSTSGTAAPVTPGASAGYGSTSGVLSGSVYGGWTATPQAPAASASSPQMRSTLPPYPHYGSGFGTALPFPRASEAPVALWNGGPILPRQETDGRSLMDRIRAWWADVTAPKGIQGRQALLPPNPSDGRVLGIIPQRKTVPTTDPFSSYGVGVTTPPQVFSQ